MKTNQIIHHTDLESMPYHRTECNKELSDGYFVSKHKSVSDWNIVTCEECLQYKR